MGQSSEGLHLNGVPLIQRSVQDSRRIDALDLDVFELRVTDVEVLGRERHRGNLYFGSGHFVDETRLAYVRVTEEQNGWGVRVNGGESSDVLSDLL